MLYEAVSQDPHFIIKKRMGYLLNIVIVTWSSKVMDELKLIWRASNQIKMEKKKEKLLEVSFYTGHAITMVSTKSKL